MSTHIDPLTSPPQSPDWHGKYRSERKKARILGATTVASALLAVGLGAWGLNAEGSSAASGPGGAGGFGPPGSSSQQFPGGTQNGTAGSGTQNGTGQFGPPGSAGENLAATLLNSDGSVNSDAVQQFVAQVPDGMLEQILAMAVSSGELTQDQADAIAAAAGTSSDSAQGTATTQET